MVSFYWFTCTFPRSLYHAELVKNYLQGAAHPISKYKPLGYSLFAHDLAVLPEPWAEEIYPNLVFFRSHSAVSCLRFHLVRNRMIDCFLQGGHFASLERPKDFLEDVEEFLQRVQGSF